MTSVAVHPGLVRSGIMRNAALPIRLITALVSSSPEKIGASLARLATQADAPSLTGELITKGKPMKVPPYIRDEATQDRLWSIGAQISGIQ